MEKAKTAVKAFAAAALLTATIFGCDEGPKPKEAVRLYDNNPFAARVASAKNQFLEVKCAPCRDCTVPESATLLREGSVIGTTKYVPNVLILKGTDGSAVEARYERSTSNMPRVERQTFTVAPGDLCVVSVSGKEIYDVYKPGAFLADSGWVYLSSRRDKLYAPPRQ
jgi:hypothetical protein